MQNVQSWRELYRCDDLLQARAVATSIAAMEFDVRLRSHDETDDDDSEVESEGPFVIEVPPYCWIDLAQVLDQIIDEQAEFDARLDAKKARNTHMVVVVLTAGTIAEIAAIMRLMDS